MDHLISLSQNLQDRGNNAHCGIVYNSAKLKTAFLYNCWE